MNEAHVCTGRATLLLCPVTTGRAVSVLDVPLLCMDSSLLSCATSGDKFLQHVLVESKKFLAEVKKVIGQVFWR